MKILLLNQAFYPDVASTAQHLTDLAVALSDRGHEVRVMCSRRTYDKPEIMHSRREIWRGIKIRRIYSFGFGKSARWRRYADFGSYLVNCLRHLIALPRFDVVVAMTSPPLISFLGALFTRIKGGKFVFWVMDLNPDEALAAGWMQPGSWSTRRLQWMLQYSLAHSDLIVALDKFMAERVETKGIGRDKIAVLPPWSHDHAVYYDAQGREQFRKAHRLAGKFVVMYSGNHSPCHPLTTLLEAARQLASNSDIVFCFVGGGSEFERVDRFRKQHRLNNIVMEHYQPLEKLSASLSSADLHVVVMGDPFVGIVHTCKVYNIRTLGIPYLYIGPSVSHIADLHPNYYARHGDTASVVSHIVEAANAQESRGAALVDAREHGQDQLVRKITFALESIGAFGSLSGHQEILEPVITAYSSLAPAKPNGASISLHSQVEAEPAMARKAQAGAS
jgi:glycosyltransferase involved in cell wall biosynthesis